MSKIVNEANRIANELAESKVFISAVPGTPLADVCNSVLGAPIIYNKNTPSAVELTQDRLDGYDVENTPARLTKLREYADVGITAVNSHLKFTRNTVSPVIKALIENFERVKATHSEVAKEYKVVTDVVPEPLCDSVVLEYLETKYPNGASNNVPKRPSKTRLSLGQDVTVENLFDLLKMGSESVDSTIKTWINRIGVDKAIAIYRGVFTETGVSTNYESVVNGGLDDLLILHLFANSLFDNPPPNTTKYSLVEYNEAVGDMRAITGFKINALLQNKETLTRSNLLVTGKDLNTVYVDKTVYANYLEQGGTDVALLGTIVSPKGYRFLNEILENKDRLADDFIAFTKLSSVEESLRNSEVNKASMKEALISTIGANWDKCYGHKYPGMTNTNFDIPEYKKQLELIKIIVSDIPTNAFEQLPHLCTTLVCDIIYPDTGAKLILAGIDRAVSKNNNIDLDQAALISTIEYILEYVFDQLVIN